VENTLIELKDIYKVYQMGEEEVRANNGVSLTICHGEFVAIVGKSGSGKSTLMNIIGALDVPTSGEYLLGGEDVGRMSDNQLAGIRNKMIGFIFQQYNLLPRLNLLENVELPLLYAGAGTNERNKRAMASLERVGLAEKWKNFPNQLSGGQQQRVALARTLAQNPQIILADEPVASLDPVTAKQVMGDFLRINKEMNITILLNIHHVDLALQYASRVVGIRAGQIVYDGPSSEVTQDILDEIYEGKEEEAAG